MFIYLTITADDRGGKGSRVRLWKRELQTPANEGRSPRRQWLDHLPFMIHGDRFRHDAVSHL
jgi:hypothetical protein